MKLVSSLLEYYIIYKIEKILGLVVIKLLLGSVLVLYLVFRFTLVYRFRIFRLNGRLGFFEENCSIVIGIENFFLSIY